VHKKSGGSIASLASKRGTAGYGVLSEALQKRMAGRLMNKVGCPHRWAQWGPRGFPFSRAARISSTWGGGVKSACYQNTFYASRGKECGFFLCDTIYLTKGLGGFPFGVRWLGAEASMKRAEGERNLQGGLACGPCGQPSPGKGNAHVAE